MDQSNFTIELRVIPPKGSRKTLASVTRQFGGDLDYEFGAAMRSKEDLPDDAEQVARHLIGSEPLSRRLNDMRELDRKTDKQRGELKKIIKGQMAYELAEWMVEHYFDEMIDEYFQQIDE